MLWLLILINISIVPITVLPEEIGVAKQDPLCLEFLINYFLIVILTFKIAVRLLE